jgi:diadenosine tetraphosphatase ApaH/serine/threonine PP2A family protein phosphatase
MRIAIISDIHSNLEALTKALKVIEEKKVGLIYCLGDIVGYGASPNECVELIRENAAKVVMGNHDVAAIDPRHADYFTKPGKIAAEWTHKTLTKENLEFLKKLPYKSVEGPWTLVHSSPKNPQDWEYVLSLEIAREQFPHFKTPLCFIGHTHVPVVAGEDLKTFDFKKDMRFIVNVGSVGQPRDGNPKLSFGLFDTDEWIYENVRIDYDIKGAAEKIKSAGLPPVLAGRLFQGL